jgi:hypothetical protein
MKLTDDAKEWIGLVGFMLLGVTASIMALIAHMIWLSALCLLGGTWGMCQYDEHYPPGKAYKRRQEAKHGDGQGDGRAGLP